jgi:UDP-glucuronate decarboxylase
MLPDDGRVVSNFIVQALQGGPITIYGDGRQTRSFCYVDDLVEGLIRLMDMADEPATPVNLGNPHESTILQLAGQVIAATGSTVEIVHRPLPVDDPLQRCPDISLAREWLQWTPAIPLAEGLEKTVAYFKKRLAA